MFIYVNCKNVVFLSAILLWLMGTNPAVAYDTAPRISDREIIESLTELKQGYKSLNQRIDDMNQNISQRLDTIDKRFDGMYSMILALFTSVMALVIAMIGYMIWDRKTAQQPFKHKLDHLEDQFSTVETQLDMKHPSGPVIARLLASLRKLAETDGKVAEVLRSFSLL